MNDKCNIDNRRRSNVLLRVVWVVGWYCMVLVYINHQHHHHHHHRDGRSDMKYHSRRAPTTGMIMMVGVASAWTIPTTRTTRRITTSCCTSRQYRCPPIGPNSGGGSCHDETLLPWWGSRRSSNTRQPQALLPTKSATTTQLFAFSVNGDNDNEEGLLGSLEDYDDDDDDEEMDDMNDSDNNNGYISEAQMVEQVNEVLLQQQGTTTTSTSSTSISLPTELSQSFLQYAMSIIMGRAIPDARDGMKPVHRRILYAMYQLNLVTSHRKCARVVGDVLGKYHPHGDIAVYDALVRMAQSFSTNYLLIDGHGNFGSIDNDPPAAMRYTECKLTTLAQEALLDDLNDNNSDNDNAIVEMTATFDGTSIEPTVLPAKLPLLLLNGASGIAVGMATNIPPHNLREVLTACIRLCQCRCTSSMQRGDILSTEELLSIIPAPDFPTGASILGTSGAQQLYTTGNGGIVQRAIAHYEPMPSSSRTAIIVTELPYQVNKALLLEKIAALVNDKKLDGISDLRDESSGREGIRVVIELKRDAIPDMVLAHLYAKTPLQTTFAGNFLALMKPTSTGTPTATSHEGNASESSDDVVVVENDGDSATDDDNNNSLVPQRFTLRQALDCFLDFRFETIRRKTRHQLNKVEARVHIVDGLLLALDKIDAVIAIIRQAESTAVARKQLLDELVGTTSEQIDAILRLQLGQLTRLNKDKLYNEKTQLTQSQEHLTRLLQIDDAVYELMIAEFQTLSDKFGVDRKTTILAGNDGNNNSSTSSSSSSLFNEMDLIRNSRSVIVVTRGGYIKRMPLKTFESQGRGTRGKRGTAPDASSSSSKSSSDWENEVAHCFTCHDHDTLLMVTDAGIAYGVRAYQIASSGRTARGQPFPQLLPNLRPGDVVTAILPVSEFSIPNEYLILATERGWIKKTSLAAFDKISSRRGLTVAMVDPGDKLKWCLRCPEHGADILVGTATGMATRFAASTLRPTARGRSRGVRTMKLRDGDTISDVNIVKGSLDRGNADVLDNDDDMTDSQGQELLNTSHAHNNTTGDGSATTTTTHENDEEPEFVLAVSSRGYGKRLSTLAFRKQARGGLGVMALKFRKAKASSSSTKRATSNNNNNKNNNDATVPDTMTCLRAVKESDEIIVFTTKGIIVRQQVSVIPTQGRLATGVLIQKLDEGDQILSVSIIPKDLML